MAYLETLDVGLSDQQVRNEVFVVVCEARIKPTLRGVYESKTRLRKEATRKLRRLTEAVSARMNIESLDHNVSSAACQ